jgi:hypothetical protein
MMKKKYFVETISLFRNVHVVEVEEGDTQTMKWIANNTDANYDEWLGSKVHDITEYSDEIMNQKYANKKYWWNGTVVVEDGIAYYQEKDGTKRKVSI